MSYWRTTREWDGETVAILACGPSRNLVDLESLQRARIKTIAINDSFRVAPWADILYFCDLKWWTGRGAEVDRVFEGRRVTLENEIRGVWRLRNSGPTGLETKDCSAIRHGSNSGYQAIGLAYHLGVSRILLYGYDMRVVAGQVHAEARPEHQSTTSFERTLTEAFLPKWPTIVEPLAAAGVEVLNCTPGSRLTFWPFGTLFLRRIE